MNKTRIMLYVTDVDQTVNFWQENFALPIVATNALPDGSQNIVLQMNAGTELSFFSRDFIKKFSPEVLDDVPSLMFFSDNFDALHEKLAGATPIADNNGLPTFAFPDPDGRYFAVAKA